MNRNRIGRRIAYSLYSLCFGISLLLFGYFVAISDPQALQKSYAIRFADPPSSSSGDPSGEAAVDVPSLIRSIPYNDGGTFYEVRSQDRIEMALRAGLGNCSNRVFGLAAYLSSIGKPYEIIHIMPLGSFLRGSGHTVIQLRYSFQGDDREKIVDVDAGGILVSDSRMVDFSLLSEMVAREGNVVSSIQLSNHRGFRPELYTDMLRGSVLGRVTSDEVGAYFRFVDFAYVRLGSPELERLVYNGLALVFGYYPWIYVGPLAKARVFAASGFRTNYILGRVFVLASRVLLALSVVFPSAWLLKRSRSAG